MLQGIASVLLLLSYGADVNAMADARHDYRTVLHYAILGGDPAVINLLLKQGARLDLGPDYQKPTALDLAILKGDPSIVEMLLEAGESRGRREPITLAYGRNRAASEGRIRASGIKSVSYDPFLSHEAQLTIVDQIYSCVGQQLFSTALISTSIISFVLINLTQDRIRNSISIVMII